MIRNITFHSSHRTAGVDGGGALPVLRVCAAEDDADEDLAEEHVTKVCQTNAVAEGRWGFPLWTVRVGAHLNVT